MGMPAHWDYDGFDPLQVQVHLRGMTADELRVQLEAQTENLRLSVQQGSRYFIIIDARAGMRAPPDVRKVQADWLAAHADLLRASCIGMAFVIRERVVRGALTAIFWVTRNPVPYTVHPSLEAAFEHAKRACADADLELPATVDDDPAAQVERALAQALANAHEDVG